MNAEIQTGFFGGEVTFFPSDLLKGCGHGGLCAAD